MASAAPSNEDASPPENLTTDIASFRRFNRMYTQYIGTLNEGLLNTTYSLVEARVLYELANRPAPQASEIAEALGVDAGYLSRILRKFEGSGLLHRKASQRDGRSAVLRLSARGRSAFKEVNRLSEVQARDALQALPPTARTGLVRCMQSIEKMLTGVGQSRSPFVLRPHRIGDMGWIVSREGIGYAEQYGWNESFEALAARIVHEFLTNFDPGRERCWIAEIDGHHVGHIFLVKHPKEPHTAKLRLLFVESSARGLGLGEALVNECIRFARTAGYSKVVLWTQSILVSAHRIYQRAGFRLVKQDPHHSFGHDLIGQEWELELSDPAAAGNMP